MNAPTSPPNDPSPITDTLDGPVTETIDATLAKVAGLLDTTQSARDAGPLVRRLTDLLRLRDELQPDREARKTPGETRRRTVTIENGDA